MQNLYKQMRQVELTPSMWDGPFQLCLSQIYCISLLHVNKDYMFWVWILIKHWQFKFILGAPKSKVWQTWQRYLPCNMISLVQGVTKGKGKDEFNDGATNCYWYRKESQNFVIHYPVYVDCSMVL